MAEIVTPTDRMIEPPRWRDVTMTQDQQQALVLTDTAGNYYVLPLDVLERARLSAEQTAELQRLLGGEVSGYWTPVPIPEASLSLSLLGQFSLGSFLPRLQNTRVEGGGGIGLTALGT
jgi:hypothetical protein